MLLPDSLTKTCRACNQNLPAAAFSINKRNSDGLQSYCKECNKAKQRAYHKTPKGRETLARGAAKQKATGYNIFGKGAITKLQQSAANRNLTCHLTQQTLAAWWHSTPDTCHYCYSTIDEYLSLRDQLLAYTGFDHEVLKFGRFFRSPKHVAIQHMTIDRRDNSGGYELDNIVKSCWICNSLKNDFWTEAQMQGLAPPMIADLQNRLRGPQRG